MIHRKSTKKTSKHIDFSKLNFKEYEKFLEFLKFQSLYEKLKTKDIIDKFQKEIPIPTSIFTKKLSTLQSICRYLKENLNISNKEISILINKSQKSVWQAYNNSKEKQPNRFKIESSNYFIPISILKQRKSVLESIVIYLKEKLNLSYHEIALVLKRDDRTIWTVYRRTKK